MQYAQVSGSVAPFHTINGCRGGFVCFHPMQHWTHCIGLSLFSNTVLKSCKKCHSLCFLFYNTCSCFHCDIEHILSAWVRNEIVLWSVVGYPSFSTFSTVSLQISLPFTKKFLLTPISLTHSTRLNCLQQSAAYLSLMFAPVLAFSHPRQKCLSVCSVHNQLPCTLSRSTAICRC